MEWVKALVFVCLLVGVPAEPPPYRPHVSSSVSVGRPYQDNSLHGIDFNQLLASTGENLPKSFGDNILAPNTGFSLPPQDPYGNRQHQGYAPPQHSYVDAITPAHGYQYNPPPSPQGYGTPKYEPYAAEDNSYHIKKHISIHVPPPEADFYPKPIYGPKPIHKREKHYKIIFIKAPVPPTPSPADFMLQPPPEQKTLVYVLVKKPEPPQPFKFPNFAPTPASKPEVYFIKYKAPHAPQYGPPPTPSPHYGTSQIQSNYVAPQPVYHAPKPYSAPQLTYAPPQPVYAAPQPAYGAPQPAYAAPQPAYAPPQPVYAAPQQSYAAPQQSYAAPQQTYTTLLQSYSTPQHQYVAPPQNYAVSSQSSTYIQNYNALDKLHQTYNAPRAY